MLQESRHSLAVSSASVSLKDSNQGVSPGATFSSEDWTGERSSPKLTHMIGGTIQFLSGYWTKSFNSLLVIGWMLPSVLCWVDLCYMAVCFMEACKPRGNKENLPARWKSQSFDRIEVISYLSGVFYLFKSKLLGPAYFHREGIPQEMNTMRWRSLKVILEVHLPRPSISTSKRDSIMVTECALSIRFGWH